MRYLNTKKALPQHGGGNVIVRHRNGYFLADESYVDGQALNRQGLDNMGSLRELKMGDKLTLRASDGPYGRIYSVTGWVSGFSKDLIMLRRSKLAVSAQEQETVVDIKWVSDAILHN